MGVCRQLDAMGLLNLDLNKENYRTKNTNKKTNQPQCLLSHPLLLKPRPAPAGMDAGLRAMASCGTDFPEVLDELAGLGSRWKELRGGDGQHRVGRRRLFQETAS